MGKYTGKVDLEKGYTKDGVTYQLKKNGNSTYHLDITGNKEDVWKPDHKILRHLGKRWDTYRDKAVVAKTLMNEIYNSLPKEVLNQKKQLISEYHLKDKNGEEDISFDRRDAILAHNKGLVSQYSRKGKIGVGVVTLLLSALGLGAGTAAFYGDNEGKFKKSEKGKVLLINPIQDYLNQTAKKPKIEA
jgi:hypothetical protein